MTNIDIKTWTFNSQQDQKDYLVWLVKNNLAYHLDDDVNDITWGCGIELTQEQLDILSKNSDAMFEYGDPWLLFEDEEFYNMYSGLPV